MDANQITHLFRGINQSLAEYTKSIKATQEYQQRDARNNTKKRGNNRKPVQLRKQVK
jgi:hypothetical protein